MSETYALDQPLTGTVDVEAMARSIPPSYQVKGMFFRRLRESVGSDWDTVSPTLSAPPPDGRYTAFKDYPQSDYFRLIVEAARRRHPDAAVREGMRRVARDDFLIFTDSQFGRVVMSAVGDDVHQALLSMPETYMKIAPGDWQVRGTELDRETVRIEFIPLQTVWEYQLGQLEGLVVHFGARPITTVEVRPHAHVVFDVRHEPGPP